MSQPLPYKLQRLGNLFVVPATIGGKQGMYSRERLLLDTGASWTLVPHASLTRLGLEVKAVRRTIPLHTANGVIAAPLMRVAWLNCFGQLLKDVTVIVHTIDHMGFDGVLGMDVMTALGLVIDVPKAEVTCKRKQKN